MNKNCARLGLKSTFFDSPHGLMNPFSKSTAHDIAKLSAFCLDDHRFREVVNTKFYKVPKQFGTIKNSCSYKWENTHKMIGQQGVTPIKTGVTNSAGPCLATSIQLESNVSLIIVLLCCKDMDCRWIETHKLAKWATNRIKKIQNFQLND